MRDARTVQFVFVDDPSLSIYLRMEKAGGEGEP
jgi:hypothetical protein